MKETMNASSPFSLPQELLAAGFTLRGESSDDGEFLQALYYSVRWPELAPTNWPDAMKKNFLDSQFQLQSQQYRANYPGLERWVIESAAAPVGRLYLLYTESELRVVDISLLPEQRGRGVGTALLNRLGCLADDLGKPLRLHVEQFNPALRLYRRMGFQERETNSLYWLMERVCPLDATKQN